MSDTTVSQVSENEIEPSIKPLWIVIDDEGYPIHCVSYKEGCNEHINDAINDFGLEEAVHWKVIEAIPISDYQAAIATMQKELADVKEDLSTYMQITNDLTNENVEFCNKIESQTKELAECQLANMQMREDMSTIRHKTYMANGEDACSAIFKIADNALSLPSTTDTLDAYVSEAVKTALKGFNSDK